MGDPEAIHLPETAAAVPHDEGVPSLSTLLGPGASEVLRAAVEPDGGRIESARPRFVNYAPGRRVAVRYSARVAWPGGRVADTTLVATERAGGPPSGAIPVEVAGTTVGVWRWPNDPRLPGLRSALDPAYVRGLLEELGVEAPNLKLSYRAYWPGRRAVVQATIPSRKLSFDPASGRLGRAAAEKLLFIKIVRPREAGSLRRLHDQLSAELPTPRCVGGSAEEGLLVLEALPGQTISACLSDGAPPPDPDELLALLNRLDDYAVGDRPRRTTADKIASHVTLLSAVLPDQAETLDRIAALYGEQRDEPLVTVHGDFHEEQVLVQDGRVTGLLDVDDVGPGQLVDDLALMIGRVRARARFAKRGREPAAAYERRLLDSFGRAVDADELRHRTAGALLGRATAPFRIQQRGWRAAARERIRMAEASLERSVRERSSG